MDAARRCYILGVRVDDICFDETLIAVEEMIANGRPHQIVTVNPEFVMTAQTNQEFRSVINQAALCLPDGVGIWWASRWLGVGVRQRVPGVDLVRQVARLSHDKGYRLFLLGAMPGVAERAAAEMAKTYPRACFAGVFAGSPNPEGAEDILARIRQAKPDVLLVAFGAPAQDTWISRHAAQLSVPVCIGVGGSFDYIAREKPLAPELLRRLGLEWLFRLITQPWRWRRMLALPRFAWQVFWSKRVDADIR